MTNVVQFSQLLLLSGHTVGTDQSPRQRPAGGLVRATVAVRSRRRSDALGDRPLIPPAGKGSPPATSANNPIAEQQRTCRDVRVGSKPVSLKVSKCCPVCPRKRTSRS